MAAIQEVTFAIALAPHLNALTSDTRPFRAQDVELLLDQAADHLDRGLRDRALWHDLMEKALQAELFEEISAYEREGDSSQWHMAQRDIGSLNTDRNVFGSQVTYLQNTKNQIDAAWSELGDFGNRGSGIWIECDMAAAVALSGLNQPDRNQAAESARERERRALERRKREITAESSSIEASRITAKLQLDDLQAKLNEVQTAASQIHSRIQRLDRMWRHRIAERDRPGGALNFKEQAAALLKRIAVDFLQAEDRLPAIAEGLEVFYGFDRASNPLPDKDLAGYGYFDDCVVWVRNAISSIIRVTSTDRTVHSTVVVNVVDDLVIPFVVDFQQLGLSQECRLLRLRGLSLSVVSRGEEEFDLWRMAVQFGDMPEQYAGRVRPLTPYQPAEVIGSTAFYNLDPRGQWTLRLMPESVGGRAFNAIAQVWIGFVMAVQV